MPDQIIRPNVGSLTSILQRYRSQPVGRARFNSLPQVLRWRSEVEAWQNQRDRGIFGGRRSTHYDMKRHIDDCLMASFIVETRHGRDLIAADLLKQIGSSGRRDGLDAFFRTILMHLAETGASSQQQGQQLWSSTQSTAREIEVVFDSSTNMVLGLGQTAFDPKVNPFGRGLELTKEAQDLGHAKGDEVTSLCEGLFKVAGGIIGVAVVGGASSGLAIATGAAIGVSVGDAVGSTVCGVIEEVSKPMEAAAADEAKAQQRAAAKQAEAEAEDEAAKAAYEGSGGNKGSGADNQSKSTQTTQKEAAPEQQETDKETGKGDGSGDGNGDGEPKDGGSGWPNPEQGYPAPDDGGGSPWSNIAVAHLPNNLEAINLMQAQSGGFSVHNVVTTFHTGDNAVSHQQTLWANLSDKAINASALHADRMRGLAQHIVDRGLINVGAIEHVDTGIRQTLQTH